MPVVISMLRGVNLGSYNRVKMDDLRALYQSLRLQDPQTYVQSGNVVFRTDEHNLSRMTQRIEDSIERKFGFRCDVILRSTPEIRDVVAKNPFAKRRGIEPSRLVVTFLAANPGDQIRDSIAKIRSDPEELHIEGRELYIYFPNGIGRSKLPALLDRSLKKSGTARNWNTVTKLLEMAEELEARKK